MIRTIEKEILGKKVLLIESDGFLHKKGSEDYSEQHGCILADGESPEDYEELEVLPAYSKEEYDKKVAELIHQRYSADEETALINNFLDGDEKYIAEYREYQEYRKQCKEYAKNPDLYESKMK